MPIPRSLRSFASTAFVAMVVIVGATIPMSIASATDVNVAGVAVHEATAIGFAAGVESTPNSSVSYVVECPADGECVAMGTLDDAATPANQQVFVAVQHGGVWGDGQVVPMPAGTYMQGFVGNVALSCAAPGECDLVATRVSQPGGFDSVHARVTGGVVQPAEILTVSGMTPSIPASTNISDISCWAPGSCMIVGSAMDPTPDPVAIQWSVVGGVASVGTPVPLPFALVDPATPETDTFAVECIAAGECVVTGGSHPASGRIGWVRVEHGGVWADAQVIAFPAGTLGTRAAMAGTISCWAGGECMVAGGAPSTARGDANTTFTFAITGGVPQQAQFITLDPAVPSTEDVNLGGLSCPAAGACIVGITVSTQGGTVGIPEFATSVDGVWGAAAAIPGLSAAGTSYYVEGIGCVRVGECEIMGHMTTSNAMSTFIAIQTAGAWQAPVTMTAASPLSPADQGGLHNVSCVIGGTTCTSVGQWETVRRIDALSSNGSRAFDAQGRRLTPEGVTPSPTGAHAITQLSVFPPAPAPTPEPVGPKYTG